ncbi:hypothetical protein ACFXPQ_20370 [Streptomyces lydicus]|uniref:hypothetical protein n=1 Tax=Streptomyces lydicus TaxID=47763 RepID=UPI00368A4A60
MSSTAEEAADAHPAASAVIPMVPVSKEDRDSAMAPGERPSRDGRGAPTAVGADDAGTDGMPPVPDYVREAARTAPDHWLGMIDPTWSGAAAPPVRAVVGQWRSGLEGEIVEWRDNPDYRPSPAALGRPAARPAEPEASVDGGTTRGSAEELS